MAKGTTGAEKGRPAPPPPHPVLVDGPDGGRPPPRTVGDAGAWLFLAAGGFVAGQVLSQIILIVVASTNGHSSDLSVLEAQAVPPPGWSSAVWWACGSAFSAPWSWPAGGGAAPSVMADMGLRFRWWDPILGIAVGLGGQYVLVTVLYLPWEHFDPKLSQQLSQPAKHLTGGFPGVDLAVIATLTVLVVPVIEELFFRGLVLRGFVRLFGGAGRTLGPVLAVTATGIVFGLAHAELLELLGLSAFGIVLSVMAYRCRRLGPCIFAHAAFNLVAIVGIASQTGWLH